MRFQYLFIFACLSVLVLGKTSKKQFDNTVKNMPIDTNRINTAIRTLFLKKKVEFPSKKLYLRAFKKEKIIEVYASDNIEYVFIKKYNFTATSGKLGPKNKEGDLQIPEGFYKIDAFNPASKFHLSFRINYPNKADSIRNKNELNLGGDIYIHGGKSTVGCIPIGDNNIEELYQICYQSYQLNSEIPVHIFPFKMDSKISKTNINYFFWNNLLPMYRFFQSHRMLGEVTDVDANGNYLLAIPWD